MLNSSMSLPAAGVGENHAVDIDVDAGADRTEPLDQHAAVAANHPHAIAINVNLDVVRHPEPPGDCAVCMERLEWAAVGPCGHREVCATYAVRIRLVEANRQCCICRAPCPTVVVTGDGGEWRGYEELAAASCKYWYHEDSAAYFDDERQYQAARRASEPAEEKADDEDGNQESHTVLFLFFVAIYFVAGVGIGLAMGGIGNNRRPTLALSSGTGFGMAAIGIMLWFLQS